jgi:ubiquinone/menaquinone biosynthesis C-methylase UbiE
MNWHETIAYVQKDKSFQDVLAEAYLSADLESNVESFRKSPEFRETLDLLFSLNVVKGSSLLDVGAGNGISSIAFALEGFKVSALEPDLSDAVGAGAIIKLKEIYDLPDLEIVSSYGEEMPFANNRFDIVYARQCMHHAYDLQKFMDSIYRVIKTGGKLLTVRDHVISDESEKQAFLKRHLLHKFYGGENAFTFEEYSNAMTSSGFKLKKIFGPTASAINYSPWSIDRLKAMLRQKLGAWAVNDLFINWGWKLVNYRLNKMPGRLYTFAAEK